MKNYRTAGLILILFAVGVLLSFLIYNAGENNPRESFRSRPRNSEKPGGVFPQRIVCLAPSVAEAVFALGCGERVVGVSSFCDYPPQAREKLNLGGYINPDFERLQAVQPDLVIMQGKLEKVIRFCRRNNIDLLQVEMSDIKTIEQDLRSIGAALGCREQAEKLCNTIDGQLKQIQLKLAGVKRKRVFLSLFRQPGSLKGLSTAGGNTFLSELIEIAGGENIFADVCQDYPTVSKESLIKRQPEVILEPCQEGELSEEQMNRSRLDWQILPALPAVKNGEIHFLKENDLLKPGPRVAQAAGLLAKILHPEVAINVQ